MTIKLQGVDLQGIALGLQIVGLFASSGMIVLGWKILYKNAKKIATRNETYALVLKAHDAIRQAQSMGHDFWCGKVDDLSKAKSRILLHQVGIIGDIFDVLEVRGIKVNDVAMAQLRNAITLDAESPDRVDEEKAIKKIDAIAQYSSELQEALYKEFLDSYGMATEK